MSQMTAGELLKPVGGPPGSSFDGGEVQILASGWRLALREFMSNKLAVVGVAIVIFFVLFCFVGPHIYVTDQLYAGLNTNAAPGGAHILGTDSNGFDELGRIMAGGQSALEIGFLAAAMASVIGTIYGAVSGLFGGVIDGLMMRIVDILLSIPFLFIILIVATKYSGASIGTESLVIGLFSWAVPARLVRGEVLTIRERDFVHASRVMGSGNTRIVFRHLIPNAISVVIVNITFLVADAILAVAYVGFLGFSLQPPLTSWGTMLSGAEGYLQEGYWWLVYPVGIALVVLVMACNFIGDALRDAADVRLRRR